LSLHVHASKLVHKRNSETTASNLAFCIFSDTAEHGFKRHSRMHRKNHLAADNMSGLITASAYERNETNENQI